MYVDATVVSDRLSELDYRELEGRDRTLAIKILETIGEMGDKATFSALRNKHVAGIDTFRIFLKWLCERNLVKKVAKEKKIREHKRGRPLIFYKITATGKEALNYLKIPEYKCIKFHTYHHLEKKFVLGINRKTQAEGWAVKNLDADELSQLVKLAGRSIWLSEIIPSPIAVSEEMRATLEESQKKGNKVLSGAISKMMKYGKTALLNECRDEETIEEAPGIKFMCDEISSSVFPIPGLCLPLGLKGDITPQQRAALNAYQRHWRRTLNVKIEKKKVLQIFANIPDGSLCKKWICQRLKENPNYFMPSQLWFELGFDVPRKWEGEVIFPYNLILVEPSFVSILPQLEFPFFTMAEEGEPILEGLGDGSIPVDEETNYRLKKRFDRFLSVLRRFQNNGDFYEAWRIKRESYNLSNENYKKLVVFKPLEAAFCRYITRSSPADNLWKAYLEIFSDLGMGKEPIKTFNDVSDAIAKGKYTIKR
jgi:DNA-binding PadR family transcriptional regulator